MGERPSGVWIGCRAKPQPWGRWAELGEILEGLSVWWGEGCCRGLGCIRDHSHPEECWPALPNLPSSPCKGRREKPLNVLQ